MNEYARQVVHIFFGIGIAVIIQTLGKDLALPVFLIILFWGLVLSDALARGHRIPLISSIVHNLERPGVLPGKGAILFVFSSIFCLFFFPVSVVVPPIVILAVLDGVAALVGRKYGRHRIGNGKSWEGTASGIAVTATVLCVLISPLRALGVSTIAGLIEIGTPIDDNLVIPPIMCLLLIMLPG